MKHVVTPERIKVVLRIAKEGGTRNDVQEALGITKDAARVLVEQCMRDKLITAVRKGLRQPAKLAPIKRWSPDQDEEQKKPTGRNWFEGWAGAPCLGLGKA
jgi:hypothetical protein